MHRSLPRLTTTSPAFRYRRPIVLSSARPLSTAARTAATTRNHHLKPLSAGVALASASFMYYYSQRDDRTLLGLRKVDAEAAPISAFSTSNASSTIAELLDDNSRACMQAKSTDELLLALFVYKLCTFPWLVDAAPHLIKLAESLKLEKLAYWIVKSTFFRQFCGGETPEDCISTMDRLARSGINCILDLSVEADLHVEESDDNMSTFAHQEKQADFILEMTKHSIRTAARGQQYGLSGALVAVKVTALTPPELLLRLNQALTTLDKQFHEHQKDGVVDAAALRQIVNQVLPTPASAAQAQQRESILSSLEAKSARLDYIEFCKLFNMGNANRNIWWDTNQTSKNNTMLTKEELAAYDRMVNRLDQISDLARNLKAGIMIDAEQSYFQEAIDHVTLNLQQKYNRRDNQQPPTVYNTYQMYTKAAQRKLEIDVERAKRENFIFAAKLVRGAYMVSERKRAQQYGYPSPIHDTIEDTHASYNGGVRFLLSKLREHQERTGEPLTGATAPIVFMVASHNRDSVVLTVQEMERHGVLPRSGVVHFGQLYGMQDPISYALGKNGYSIYKYLPYGMVGEVIPYLIRRAQENSAVLGSVTKERELMFQEIMDRLSGKSAPVLVTSTANAASSQASTAAPAEDSEVSPIAETA